MVILARVVGFPCRDGTRIDLDVHAGQVVRLIGGNGTGKTSLLRALAGLPSHQRPDSVMLGDQPPAALSARDLAARVTLVPQAARDALVGLTVAGEARLRGKVAPPSLAPDQDTTTLSSGEARTLALGVANAPLLLLDEPDEGLDAKSLARLRDRIANHAGAVVIADHARHFQADVTVDLGGAAHDPAFDVRGGEGATRQWGPARVQFPGRTLQMPRLDLGPGMHVITGPIGSGKSTLLAALAGSLPDISPWPSGLQWVPADARVLFHHETVRAELGAAKPCLVPDDILERHPWSLSGGEGQRLALDKALGRAAQTYLLDEPEAHLDAAGRAALAAMIDRRIGDGACVIVATHDPGIIKAAQTNVTLEAP